MSFAPHHKRTGLLTAFAALLIMAAIMFRAMVPAGFMPDIAHGQPFKMVICTIDGPQNIDVSGDLDPHQKPVHDNAQNHDAPCAFSVHTAFADTAVAIILSASALPVAAEIVASLPVFPVPQKFFGNASSRAPPVTV